MLGVAEHVKLFGRGVMEKETASSEEPVVCRECLEETDDELDEDGVCVACLEAHACDQDAADDEWLASLGEEEPFDQTRARWGHD